ncbi:hypothetical protein Mx8p04 [Myxococcus phage Mx8]|uniref:p4 n=1 Tax=Myxococcus phage Mx8 TaxID=49964 RepID=O03955_9CAUD|nr:hypothetical protein Mx8p04 [Myxococcus phage Mx8]AAC48899.1 unknown [Myxococcus phage Mx8]AAK94339.1 p4 [Myxococcus phage Mx8]
MTPQVAARHRRQPRPVRLTAARRDSSVCCREAVRVACSCGAAYACRVHEETHGSHTEEA